MLIAHSINAQGKRHDLVEHLKSVAELERQMSQYSGPTLEVLATISDMG